MKKALWFTLYGVGLSSAALAQQMSPSVIAAAGGSTRTQTMDLEWTLGESVVETGQTASQIFTQGFHQPMLQVTEQTSRVAGSEPGRFTIAPNPVTAFLTVTATQVREEALQLKLTDMAGRQFSLPDLRASEASVQVDMTAYPAGTYLLRIGTRNGAPLTTFKVLKVQ